MGKKITRIPASVNLYTATPINEKKKRRVAGYARVSTEHEEQATSYEAQMDYYTNYITSRDDCFLSGCILMRVLQLQTPKEEKALIR